SSERPDDQNLVERLSFVLGIEPSCHHLNRFATDGSEAVNTNTLKRIERENRLRVKKRDTMASSGCSEIRLRSDCAPGREFTEGVEVSSGGKLSRLLANSGKFTVILLSGFSGRIAASMVACDRRELRNFCAGFSPRREALPSTRPASRQKRERARSRSQSRY